MIAGGRSACAAWNFRYDDRVGTFRLALTIALAIAFGAPMVGACGLSVVGSENAEVLPDGAPPPGADGGGANDGGRSGSDAAAPDSGTCTMCGGACVDTSTDVLHCGACSRACARNQVCTSGTCTTPCPAKQVACNGACCAGVCAAGSCKLPELWLRADEGVTTGASFVWADQSGKGRDVSQNAIPRIPTVVAGELAGRQVVRFSGGQRLEGPDVQGFQLGAGDLAWFHVSRSRGNPDERNQVFGTIRNGAPFRGMTAGFGPEDRPYGLLREGDGNEVFLRHGTGSQDWVIMDLRRKSGVTELRRNGVVVVTAASSQNVSGGNIIIGSERVGGTEYLNGDIAEILIFGGSFSDAERSSVVTYLSERHQIAVQ